MTSQRPILVTGSHRSGTTWVGRIIAHSPYIEYIYEPFQPIHDFGICRGDFPYWFTYVCDRNAPEYYDILNDTVAMKYNFLYSIRKRPSLRNLFKSTTSSVRFSRARLLRRRALLKDPIAVFSAEWLDRTFDMAIVVMVRHPAAFASSVKLMGNKHPFKHFLQQPLLMQEHLEPFRAEIERFAKNEQDLIDQAALLWRLIHYVILKYQDKHPDWLFIRHEDLSRSPVSGFKKIYEKLEIPFDQRIESKIISHSFATHPSRGDYSLTELKRESLKNIALWKTRLTHQEIGRIREQVSDVAQHFYDQDDW